MIIRRHLLRNGRISIFQSQICPSRTESITSRIPSIQTRSFRLEDVHLNLPESARGRTFDELVTDGVLNANVAKWLQRRQLKGEIGGLGAEVTETGFQPHRLVTHPPTVDEVSLELLLASQAHLGHATALWHPGNARYIFGIREGVHIISLEATAAHLRRAAKVVESVADQAGLILFVGTRKGQERAVVGAAKRAHGCHMFDRWIPGTLTNGQKILERCDKKVVDQKDRHLTGFEEQLAPLGSIKPDLVVCLNPVENYTLLHECALYSIPTIGVVDTNCNPTWVTYPIPANDDSLRSVQVIVGVLGQAAEAGRKKRLARAIEDDEVIQPPPHPLVLPEEFDSDDSGEVSGEVIDLRNLKTGNRVRFAYPQAAQQVSQPTKSAEDKLQDLYEQDKSLQEIKKAQQIIKGQETVKAQETKEIQKDAAPSRKIDAWDPYASDEAETEPHSDQDPPNKGA